MADHVARPRYGKPSKHDITGAHHDDAYRPPRPCGPAHRRHRCRIHRPARADCTATQRAQIEQRLIGTWGVRLASGLNSCITLRYETGGKFVQSASHCSGGGAASFTKNWAINDQCQLVQIGVGEPRTPHNLQFLDGNREVKAFDSESTPFTLYRK